MSVRYAPLQITAEYIFIFSKPFFVGNYLLVFYINVFIVDDFNVCPNKMFALSTRNWLGERFLMISCIHLIRSDTHGPCSWLDHYVS